MAVSGGAVVLPVPVPARGRAVAVTVAVLSATYLLLLVLRPAGLLVPLSDVATTLAAGAAAVFAAVSARSRLGAMRRFWWLLAAACAAWAVGEATWTWYEVVLDVPVPYPSVADVFYLAGTPLAVAAFASHPAAHHPRGVRGRRLLPLLDGLAVSGSLLVTSWTFVLAPLWRGSGGMTLGDLVAVAYPFGDVVVLVLVVLAAARAPRGDTAATTYLLGGLVVMAVTDSLYTYLAEVGSYDSGDLVDLGWFASYLALAAAAVVSSPTADTDPAPERPPAPWRAGLPLVPVLAVLVVLAVTVPSGHRLDRTEWGLALALCVVTVLREVIARSSGRRARTVAPPRAPRATGYVDETLAAVTLEILATRTPTAQERVQQVSGSVVSGLGAVAAAVALWDLSLLVRR